MTMCRKVLFSLFVLSLFTSMAGMEIFSWSLFLFALVFLVRERNFAAVPLKIDVVLWAFVAIVGVSLAVNVDNLDVFLDYFGSLRWVFLLYTYCYLMKSNKEPLPEKSMLIALCVGLLLACSYATLQFLTGWNPIFPHRAVDPIGGNLFRATGFFNMPLTFAYCVGMGGLLLLGLSRNIKDKYILYAIYAAVAMSMLGVLVSITRGAWVAMFVSFTGFCIMRFGVRRIWKYAIAILAVGVVIFTLNASLQQRLASIIDTNNHSNSLRFSIWKANLQMIKEHPWLGMGLGQNKDALPEYYAKVGIQEEFIGHAHSNYIQILAGTGVFGFLCYIFISLYFLILAYRLWKTNGVYSGLGLGSFWAQIYMHIGGLTECNFTDGEVTHIVILCWALVAVAAFRQRKGLKT